MNYSHLELPPPKNGVQALIDAAARIMPPKDAGSISQIQHQINTRLYRWDTVANGGVTCQIAEPAIAIFAVSQESNKLFSVDFSCPLYVLEGYDVYYVDRATWESFFPN